MKTWSGSDAPLTKGEPNILDLVMHLGRTRRWGGFGDPEYTVLHHSFLCALIWLKAGYTHDLVYLPLLHDGHEAYTGDVPSPVKALMGEGVKDLEGSLDERIGAFFGLPRHGTSRSVKVCDLAALVIEAPFFAPPGASAPCEHSAGLEDVPEEYRDEVRAVVAKVLPNFEAVIAARRSR